MIPAIPDGRIGSIGESKTRLVVDHVTPVPEFLKYSVRLLCKVNLEADVKYDIILFLETAGNASSDRDDGHKIDEGGTIFSIVDKTRLALLIVGEVLLHVSDSFGGSIMSSFSLSNGTTGCLEEAAVTTEDLMLVVACQTIKRGGGVNDGGVISPYVDYDKGAGHVNGA
jgi:hypothetical protein